MIKGIFPIIALENEEIIENGTGFFVNSEGYFITAGHVVNNETNKYNAQINDKLYSIKEIYKEYCQQQQQNAPIFKDLFIGKVDYLPSVDDICRFSDLLEVNEFSSVCGYTSKTLIPELKAQITIDELYDLDFENDGSSDFPTPKLKTLRYYEIKTICEQLFIYRTYNGDIQYFKNGIMVDMREIDLSGMSGGPLMKDGTVMGMIIAKNNCISARYMMCKLSELNIIHC